MEELSQEKKLLNLLNDMEEIEEKLSEWLDDTNIFQILKLSRTEIRHSNFLAYLLSPHESHQWQDKFFKAILKAVIEENESLYDTVDYFDLVLNDYNDLMICREHQNIDLLLVSKKNKVVMAIENKIGASESSHQLTKYHQYVESHCPYNDYNKLYVFLTPEREEATNSNWYSFSYYDIIEIIERLIKTHSLSSKINFFVSDYINALRRDVLVDERLQTICHRIYSQHQEALDLIFEYKSDNVSLMSELYKEALTSLEKEGLLISNSNYSGKTIVRFEMAGMNKMFSMLPNNHRGGWEKHNAYCFEISNRNAKSSGNVTLVFTSKIDSESLLVLENALNNIGYHKDDPDWQWWTVESWKIKKVDQNFVENIITRLGEEDREVIVKEIADSLKIELVEIKKFCQKLIAEYTELSHKQVSTMDK